MASNFPSGIVPEPVLLTEYQLRIHPAATDRRLLLGKGKRISLLASDYLTIEIDINFCIPSSWEKCSVAYALETDQLLHAFELQNCLFRELIPLRHRQIPHIKHFIANASPRRLWQLINEQGLLEGLTLTCDGILLQPLQMPCKSIDEAFPPSASIVIEWSLPKTAKVMREIRLRFSMPQTRQINSYPILLRGNTEVEHLVAGVDGVGQSISLYECFYPTRMKMRYIAIGNWFDYRFPADVFSAATPVALKLEWESAAYRLLA